MARGKNVSEMGLGEIIRELDVLNHVRAIERVEGLKAAYATAPSHVESQTELLSRQDLLYSQLDEFGELIRSYQDS